MVRVDVDGGGNERESWRGEDEVEGGKGHNEWGVIKRGCSGESRSGWKR